MKMKFSLTVSREIESSEKKCGSSNSPDLSGMRSYLREVNRGTFSPAPTLRPPRLLISPYYRHFVIISTKSRRGVLSTISA